MSFVAYMIRSESTGMHYYGHTSNLTQRIISHNTTQNQYTRKKGPWVLVGAVNCATQSEACNIEIKLKKMKNPQRARAWIQKRNSLQ